MTHLPDHEKRLVSASFRELRLTKQAARQARDRGESFSKVLNRLRTRARLTYALTKPSERKMALGRIELAVRCVFGNCLVADTAAPSSTGFA